VFLNKQDPFQNSLFPEIDQEKYFYNEDVPDFYYTFEN
jgi:hypothetical protein